MAPLRRIKLTKLNEHLVCPLCKGYFVEATTITECLHTFCRTCIVGFLQSSSYCPVCDVQVHKTKPILALREDKTLQDVVFKLVPDLFHNEMARRARFYKEHPEAGGDRTEQSLKERRHFFHVDDQISLSLEFLPPAHAHAHALGLRPLRAPSFCLSQPPSRSSSSRGGESKEDGKGNGCKEAEAGSGGKEKENSKDEKGGTEERGEDDAEEKVQIPLRRYLKCPAAVQIRLLEKFIRLKYNLSSHHRVDIVHGGDCLSPELTLLDVVYMYKWTEDEPLKLQYTVIAPPLPLRKRPRPSSGKAKHSTPESSPKKLKLDKENIKLSPSSLKNNTKETMRALTTKINLEKEELKPLIKKCKTDEKEVKNEVLTTEKLSVREGEESKNGIAAEELESLNSSRDEADDAMVIDEGSMTDPPSDGVTDMETDSSCTIKDSLHKSLAEEKQQPVTSSSASTLSSHAMVNNTSIDSLSSNSGPVTSSVAMSTATTNTTITTSSSKAIFTTSNSSIESLKALVNNSNYSGFPSKQVQSQCISTEKNTNALSSPKVNAVQSSQYPLSIPKTVENCISTPGRPATPNALTRVATTVTPVRSNSCNTPARPSTPGTPVRPNTPVTPGRSSTPSTPTRPTNSNSVSKPTTPVTVTKSIASVMLSNGLNMKPASEANSALSKSKINDHNSKGPVSSLPTHSVQSMMSPMMNKPVSSHISFPSHVGTISVPSKSVPGPRPFLSTNSTMNQSHPLSLAPNSPSPVTSAVLPPASTSLTPALKTPLTSSTSSRMPTPPTTQKQQLPPQSIGNASSSNASLVNQRPSPSPTPRLVSNSYRAPNLQANNGIRMNGIMSGAPRPIMDPTKPRLGRPPNSARIAAAAVGRLGPTPILPRGAPPREAYGQKVVNKGESARGRPKGQTNSSGRGTANRFIAPQQPPLNIPSTGVPINRPGARPHLPKSSPILPHATNKEIEMNGLKNLGSIPSPHINGVTSQQMSKELVRSGANQPNHGTKQGVSGGSQAASLNGNLIKEVRKSSTDPLSISTSKGPHLGSPKTPTSSTSPSATNRPPSGKPSPKSPGRKAHGGSASSILSIAQNLANKQLQQLDPSLHLGGAANVTACSTSPSGSTMPPASVVAALTPQLSAATAAFAPQLNPAFCAAYMSKYAAVQNLLSLSLAAMSQEKAPASHLDPSNKKAESVPMDLSPTNKGAPSTQLSASTRPLKVPKGNSSKKPPSTSPSLKVPSVLSPKSVPTVLSPKGVPSPTGATTPQSASSPTVPSPKPAQSPSPDSPSVPNTPTISPPTPEVTITKLPNSSDTPSASTPSAPSSAKTGHTNTVSITKRPSSSSSVGGSTNSTGKFAVTRSPSNPSVRQIPNPSLLSHQSEVRSHSANKGSMKSKQNLHSPSVNNNNNNNNNNNSKTVKVDL